MLFHLLLWERERWTNQGVKIYAVINFEFKQFGDIGFLFIKEIHINKERIEELKEVLMVALKNVSSLYLCLTRVKEINLSLLEQLKLICNYMYKLNKHLIVTGIDPEIAKEIGEVSIYSSNSFESLSMDRFQ